MKEIDGGYELSELLFGRGGGNDAIVNVTAVEKMFEGPETFVIGNDSIKKCYIHSENKFVLAEETKITKNFQMRVGCP